MTQHTELIKEYRPTMHADVLHMWAKDAANALEAQSREIAALKAQEAELCTLYGLAEAECKRLRKDAALGRVAMRFVDRAGDPHPGIDDAEDICSSFHEAMMAELETHLPAAMKGAPHG